MSVPKFNIIFDTKNSFYSKGLLFTGLSLFAAALNYALYPLVAHNLSVGNFGEFSALLALITQIGGVMLAFNIISIFLVAKHGEVKSKQYLSVIQKGLILIFAGLTLVSIMLFPIIGGVLRISSIGDLFVLSGILLCTIPAAVWSGYFQGNGELVKVGAFSLFASGAKLVFAVFGAYYWGLTGALFGVLVGTLLGLIIFWALPGDKPPLIENLKFVSNDNAVIKKFSSLIVRSVVAVGILSLIQIIDLLSVKSIFSSDVAGQYAGISTLSRIVYYTGFIIVWVLLPEIAKATPMHRKNLIHKSYLLYLALATVAGLGALIVGKQAISFLLGSNYNADVHIILWAILFQSAVLFMTFQAFVLLVLNKRVVLPLIVGTFSLFICTLTLNQSILDLIRAYALFTIVLSVWLGIIISRQTSNEKIPN